MAEDIRFEAVGLCVGNLWGGGIGAYPTERYSSEKIENLIDEITKDIESGAIDSGMGFESIKGALMQITTIRKIFIDGRKFTSDEVEYSFFGNLDAEEMSFLEDNFLEAII